MLYTVLESWKGTVNSPPYALQKILNFGNPTLTYSEISKIYIWAICLLLLCYTQNITTVSSIVSAFEKSKSIEALGLANICPKAFQKSET